MALAILGHLENDVDTISIDTRRKKPLGAAPVNFGAFEIVHPEHG